MQRKLDLVLEHQLLIRVTISKEIHIFSLRQLAEGFDLSVETLHRYASPHLRELSRAVTRRAYKRYQNENRSDCHTCGKSVDSHKRCECGILMHGGVMCLSCVNSKIRKNYANSLATT